MNIYQNNTYKKDLSQLHFDDEPRVQERQKVKDQQSYTPISIAYLSYSSSSQEHQSRQVFHARLHGRFIEIKSNPRKKKMHETNRGFSFVGGSFSIREFVKTPVLFRRKRQPQHQTHTGVIRLVKGNKLDFSSIEINNQFLPKSTVTKPLTRCINQLA